MLEKKIKQIEVNIPRTKQKNVPVKIDGVLYYAISGGQAIWLPQGKRGIKITKKEKLDIIKYLTSIHDYEDYLPKIYDYYVVDDFLVIVCDNIKQQLPEQNFITKCVKWFIANHILPDKGWSKSINIHGNKIIDFHYYKHSYNNYFFPVRSISKIEEIHKKALDNFKKSGLQKNGLAKKWKGKIYQGMNFDDGNSKYNMKGYTSDQINFDSYVKLQFSCSDFCTGRTVLDIGCNEGFFVHQARINNAKKCVGIDLSEDDIILANEISQELIAPQNDFKFFVADANEYINKCDVYDIIYLHSVVHRFCDDLKQTEDFFKRVKAKVNRLVIYETPYEHPRMRQPLPRIEQMLKKYFRIVRPLYSYNAYSSGYRKIYSLYK